MTNLGPSQKLHICTKLDGRSLVSFFCCIPIFYDFRHRKFLLNDLPNRSAYWTLHPSSICAFIFQSTSICVSILSFWTICEYSWTFLVLHECKRERDRKTRDRKNQRKITVIKSVPYLPFSFFSLPYHQPRFLVISIVPPS